MYQMLITINGQPQMSFDQFQESFTKAFGRDMTEEERTWFKDAFPKPELTTAFLGDAA